MWLRISFPATLLLHAHLFIYQSLRSHRACFSQGSGPNSNRDPGLRLQVRSFTFSPRVSVRPSDLTMGFRIFWCVPLRRPLQSSKYVAFHPFMRVVVSPLSAWASSAARSSAPGARSSSPSEDRQIHPRAEADHLIGPNGRGLIRGSHRKLIPWRRSKVCPRTRIASWPAGFRVVRYQGPKRKGIVAGGRAG